MRKILVLIFIFFFNLTAVSAAVQLKVTAQQEFQTESPTSYLDVKIREDAVLGKYFLPQNSILRCKILQIVDPKRGKINATFFVQPVSYTTTLTTFKIDEEMYGKYSKTVLSKEELKKIPPSEVIQKTVLLVGNYFVKGLSLGVSFVKGFVTNPDDNRLKSGVVKAYEESPLSYISEGEQLDIKIGDEFYLIFKIDNENEQNYSYTIQDN